MKRIVIIFSLLFVAFWANANNEMKQEKPQMVQIVFPVGNNEPNNCFKCSFCAGSTVCFGEKTCEEATAALIDHMTRENCIGGN